MKVLFGLHQPDEGEILITGKRVRMTDPCAAMRHGLGMVHQHFHARGRTLTVAENVTLGAESRRASGCSRPATPSARSWRLPSATACRWTRRRASTSRSRAATRRDPRRSTAARARAHPRRAHRCAHAAGSGRVVRGAPRARRRRRVHRAYHAQARRGEGHGDAPDRAARGYVATAFVADTSIEAHGRADGRHVPAPLTERSDRAPGALRSKCRDSVRDARHLLPRCAT